MQNKKNIKCVLLLFMGMIYSSVFSQPFNKSTESENNKISAAKNNEYLGNIIVLSGESRYFKGSDNFIVSDDNKEFIIYSGGDVSMEACTSILLKEGFYAAPGSSFKARYGECQNDILKNDNSNKTLTSVLDLKFNIFPNPNEGKFIVEISGFDETNNIEFIIYDITGSKVIQEKFINNILELDLTEFSKGLYFGKVSVNNEPLWVDKIIYH